MVTSLGLIFLAGLAAGALAARLGLPRLVGMLAAGIALGPYALNLLDGTLLSVSAALRQMALIVILLRAGLSLDPADLRRVGRPALLMAFVPACCEIAAFLLFAPPLLGLTRLEAAIMGAVVAAVSPAVVVPRMVQLMETRRGTAQGIPQLIMAGASCDDVFVIVLFSTFARQAQGGGAGLGALAGVPVSIVLGALAGAGAGALLSLLFDAAHRRGCAIRGSIKLLLVLGTAFLLVAAEDWLAGIVPLAGLLAVIGMACALRARCAAAVSRRLSDKLGKLWLAGEVVLFTLVGAAVDIRYTLHAGAAALGMLAAALVFRMAGVALCLLATPLRPRERLFCALAYLPKATVQAAIGAAPLAMGLPCGQLVLSVAVLAILTTAPLGALIIDRTAPRQLTQAAEPPAPPRGAA